MTKLFALFCLSIMALSCAHRTHYQEFVTKVEAATVRNPQEIKEHVELLLKLHPTMSEETRDRIRGLLLTHIDEHQRLKDQESKVVQVLLTETLSSEERAAHQHNGLKDLNELYELKGKNIARLLEGVTDATKGLVERPAFHRELQILMKELR